MPLHLIAVALWAVLHGVAVIRVLLNGDITPSGRIAWLMLIIIAPFVGVAAYFMFGEPWMARRFRRAADLIERQLANVDLTEDETAGRKSVPERFRPAFAACEHLSGCATASGNSARLSMDSNAAIDDMVADFDAARDTIHISFYIWLTDTNGLKVVEALKRAAARGVICRVGVDALGSRALIASDYWRAMKDAGIRLIISLKPSLPLLVGSANRPDLRNHRKIVVVDNAITYCGSQNCADPEFRIKPKFAPWVDIFIRYEGPVVRQNQRVFASTWLVEYGEDLSELLDDAPEAADAPGFPAIAFGTGPLSPRGAMSDVFVAVLGSALHEAVISTPYFVPDPSLLASILSCARRGVKTTLILPARNDSRAIASISSAYFEQLLAAGVELHLFQGGLLHAKTLVVDKSLALVGSANMDFRSLYLNFENNILFYAPDMAAQVRARQDSYLARSIRVSRAEVEARPSIRVAYDNLLTTIGPVF